MEKIFHLELNQAVQITCSGEQGVVLGRAEYAETERPQYFLRYKSADGRAVEQWWSEKALTAI